MTLCSWVRSSWTYFCTHVYHVFMLKTFLTVYLLVFTMGSIILSDQTFHTISLCLWTFSPVLWSNETFITTSSSHSENRLSDSITRELDIWLSPNTSFAISKYFYGLVLQLTINKRLMWLHSEPNKIERRNEEGLFWTSQIYLWNWCTTLTCNI